MFIALFRLSNLYGCYLTREMRSSNSILNAKGQSFILATMHAMAKHNPIFGGWVATIAYTVHQSAHAIISLNSSCLHNDGTIIMHTEEATRRCPLGQIPTRKHI